MNSSSNYENNSKITFVTGNAGKLREVQSCLKTHIMVDSVKIDLPELQSNSVFEISKAKALSAYEILQRPVLVEDTALCFEALNGLPGPFIKWFLESIGTIGLIKMLKGFNNTKAYASCVFTYCSGPNEVQQFEGKCEGKIVEIPRGEKGFGWDSIFEPKESQGKTFAEISEEEKNIISHRAKALVALREYFCK